MDIRKTEYSEYVTLIFFGEFILAVVCAGIGAVLVLLAVHYWKKKTKKRKESEELLIVYD